MLAAHPHIRHLHIKKSHLSDRTIRRLIVDTDLEMPPSGRIEENGDLLALHNYLEIIAANDFDDFDELEIRTPPLRNRKRPSIPQKSRL